MTPTAIFMRVYVAVIALLTIGGLAYIFISPPESMRVDRYGVPYFTPPVINPETGKPVSVDALVRNFKGQ
ncbi:MAG TPA: hypothetical protein ENI55_00845 [Alphaproteobacteria bacterium]|nr:hypothetical protein [Alphaproteobacteria bacterium]